LLMLRNTAANIVRQMSNATTCGCLSYDIHARFAAHLCASTRVDRRGPVVDSVLIAGHAGDEPGPRAHRCSDKLQHPMACCMLVLHRQDELMGTSAFARAARSLSRT